MGLKVRPTEVAAGPLGVIRRDLSPLMKAFPDFLIITLLRTIRMNTVQKIRKNMNVWTLC